MQNLAFLNFLYFMHFFPAAISIVPLLKEGKDSDTSLVRLSPNLRMQVRIPMILMMYGLVPEGWGKI